MRLAFRTFFSILDHGRIDDEVIAAFAKREERPPATAPRPQPPSESSDRALQMLALLQRDGRLIDFLMEDLSGYQDGQIGAAARDVHAACRKVVERYLSLEPVLDDSEGSMVTVDRDADPASIKIVGNVAGSPPFRGVLRHRGWTASRIDLPPLGATGRSILAPAEVEVS